MTIRGIIFDLDGTLLDTITDLANSANDVLQKHGYKQHTEEEYKTFIGNGMQKLLERSLPQGANIDEMLLGFLACYDVRYMEHTKAYEGIHEMLRKLAKRGIKLAVNSNKKDKYTKALIKQNFADIPFIEALGERENKLKKPSPEAALEIAQVMKLQPHEMMYIGDSKTDFLTGQNAGMITGVVTWGFDGLEKLKELGAEHIFNKPYEILDSI